LIAKRVPLNAQIESEVVDLVRVLSAGDKRYNAKRGISGVAMPVPPFVELDSPMRKDQILKTTKRTKENERRVAACRVPCDSRTKIETKMKVQARC